MVNETELKILKIILKEKRVTMGYLGESLNLHKRTIERNIFKLIDKGVPISIFRGRGGGVSLDGDIKSKDPFFNRDEVWKFCLAFKVYDSIYKDNFREKYIQVFGRINPDNLDFCNMLDEILEVDLIEEKVDLYDNRGMEGKKLVEEFSIAIMKRNKVNLRIRNNTNSLTVIPNKIILKKDGAYIRYYADNEEHILKFNKVMHIKVLKEKFEKN